MESHPDRQKDGLMDEQTNSNRIDENYEPLWHISYAGGIISILCIQEKANVLSQIMQVRS